jgi:toxin-antitoxin system PIN domain toxin
VTVHLCDANIWLALAVSGHGHHHVARSWLDGIEAPASVLFCRTTQAAFLRLLTNAAVQMPFGDPPLSNRAAWAAYDAMLADERIAFAGEPEGIETRWREFGARSTASLKLWTDAYLAAFALAGGYQFVTTDTGFRQFRGLDLLLLER